MTCYARALKATMKAHDKQLQHLTRDRILKLMSDDEIARVSMAESAPRLEAGEAYLDLDSLEQGVQRSLGPETRMGCILPRKAVRERTWERILRVLAGAQVSAPPSGGRTDSSY